MPVAVPQLDMQNFPLMERMQLMETRPIDCLICKSINVNGYEVFIKDEVWTTLRTFVNCSTIDLDQTWFIASVLRTVRFDPSFSPIQSYAHWHWIIHNSLNQSKSFTHQQSPLLDIFLSQEKFLIMALQNNTFTWFYAYQCSVHSITPSFLSLLSL